jgi:threonine dehydratase
MQSVLPTAADVAEAHLRIRDWIVETPVLESDALSRRVGTRVLLKAECLQRGGSFKIRGALNRILQLSHAERSAGVVAFSSGNHAQAVAIAARWLGCHATIVMPSDAPRTKLDGTRAYGAEVVLYDRERDDREAIAARLATERGAALVPPFDHPQVIAGQGTAALELGRALADKHVTLDALYVPCSGGGLVAGSALAIKSWFADCSVYAVEPVGYTELADSLRAGERRVLTSHPPTLCDGLRAPTPGAITFAISGRARRRRRRGARGDGAGSRAAQGRVGAVRGRGARRAVARTSARPPLRRRDPFGRQRRPRIVVEVPDSRDAHPRVVVQKASHVPSRQRALPRRNVRHRRSDGP